MLVRLILQIRIYAWFDSFLGAQIQPSAFRLPVGPAALIARAV